MEFGFPRDKENENPNENPLYTYNKLVKEKQPDIIPNDEKIGITQEFVDKLFNVIMDEKNDIDPDPEKCAFVIVYTLDIKDNIDDRKDFPMFLDKFGFFLLSGLKYFYYLDPMSDSGNYCAELFGRMILSKANDDDFINNMFMNVSIIDPEPFMLFKFLQFYQDKKININNETIEKINKYFVDNINNYNEGVFYDNYMNNIREDPEYDDFMVKYFHNKNLFSDIFQKIKNKE